MYLLAQSELFDSFGVGALAGLVFSVLAILIFEWQGKTKTAEPETVTRDASVDKKPAKTKTKVIVTWFRREPKVEVDGDVELVTVDGDGVSQFVLEYKGVTVYYAEQDEDTSSDYWLGCWPRCYYESDDAFDWRDLADIPDQLLPQYVTLYPDCNMKQVLAYNIDAGHITESGLIAAQR